MVVNATTIDPVTLQPQSLRLNVAAPTRTTSYSLKTDVQVTQNHTAAVEYGQNEQDRRTAGLQSGFDLPERAYTGESRERDRELLGDLGVSHGPERAARARVAQSPGRSGGDHDAGRPRARGVQCRRQSGRAVQGRHDGQDAGGERDHIRRFGPLDSRRRAGRRRPPGAGRSRELQRHVHLRQRRGSRCGSAIRSRASTASRA